MDHLLTYLWCISGGICFHAGLIFAFFASRARRDRTLALFAVLCFGVAGLRLTDVFIMLAPDPAAVVEYDRVWVGIACILNIVMVWFVAYYTGVFAQRFLLFVSAVFAAVFVLNAALPNGLTYSNFTNVFELHQLPWDEHFPVFESVPGSFFPLVLFGVLLFYGFSAYAAWKQFQRGERRAALVLGIALGMLMIGALHDQLVGVSQFAILPFPIQAFCYLGLVVVMGMEISHRVADATRARQSLIETRLRYRQLVEQAADGFFVYEPIDGRILDVNEQACTQMGYLRDELLGMHVPDLVPGMDLDSARQRWAALRPNAPITVHSTQRRRDGTTFPAEVRLGVSARNDERLVVALSRDMSERAHADEVRRVLETQVLRAQKLEALGTLAGGIAHDFNNLLSAVLGYSELARAETPEGANTHGHLDRIIAAVMRARDLVRQILTFSRRQPEQSAPISVAPIIREAMNFLRASLPANIDIRVHLNTDASIDADSTQIHQVIVNLVTNAGHVLERTGGVLTVKLDDVEVGDEFALTHPGLSTGPHVRIAVSDTGPGIPDDVMERLFDPFFTTKEDGKGTGLGLSVVHRIVENHDGGIYVTSTPGSGSEFQVFLPRVAALASDEKIPLSSTPTGTERVLFVDDDPALARMGDLTLSQLGYSVESLTCGREALKRFQDAPYNYDLVVTDMTMPDLAGDRLATELMDVRSDIPVILLTGFSSVLDEKGARAIGIRAFMRKPVARADLAQRIRTVLDSAPADMSRITADETETTDGSHRETDFRPES